MKHHKQIQKSFGGKTFTLFHDVLKKAVLSTGNVEFYVALGARLTRGRSQSWAAITMGARRPARPNREATVSLDARLHAWPKPTIVQPPSSWARGYTRAPLELTRRRSQQSGAAISNWYWIWLFIIPCCHSLHTFHSFVIYFNCIPIKAFFRGVIFSIYHLGGRVFLKWGLCLTASSRNP